MCGIAGVLARNASGSAATSITAMKAMVGALRHRGADAFGVYRDEDVVMGHARLAIIDLVSGSQPLCDDSGGLWIVFNGELFNYLELRQELIGLGRQFRTRSDTEVVINAYAQWGEAAFERFNGQWALAVWDSRAKTLVLARDRFGICPLFVYRQQGALYFASELKAIFAHPKVDAPRFDPVGLDQTFTFWSIVPPRSVFQAVEEVPPGCLRKYTAEGCAERRYWHWSFPRDESVGFRGSLNDAVDAVKARLQQATRLRLQRSDVEVASYLSGGLDSSVVAALGHEVSGERLTTFSLRFEDDEFDETPFQRAMVEHIRSRHAELSVARADIARVFPDVVYHAERPVLRTAAAPLFLLSRKVRDSGIKVVVTGEGADEIFAGYDIFKEAKIRRFWARQPASPWRPRLLARLYPYLARSPVAARAMTEKFFGLDLARYRAPGFSHRPRWQTTATLKRFYSADQRQAVAGHDAVGALLDCLPSDFGNWSALAQDQYLELTVLLPGYLLSSQGDRMLMAHGVEGRYPFLDHNVVALANTLPDRYKLHVLNEKYVLKRMAAQRVPDRILARSKQPYRAPDAASFVGAHPPPWLEAVFDPQQVADAGVFDPQAVDGVWRKCRKRGAAYGFSNVDNMALVGILSTQLLYEQFIRRPIDSGGDLVFSTVVDRLAA